MDSAKLPRDSRGQRVFAGSALMGAVVLALTATAVGFVLGLVLLCVLGDKAWSHAVALSVGVFLVVYFALLVQVRGQA
jgi:L-asparagine transporter-like permease